MSNLIIQSGTLDDIADAIRAKTGSQASMTPAQMVTNIASIPTGTTPTGTMNISSNGTYDVTNYASAVVAVSSSSSEVAATTYANNNGTKIEVTLTDGAFGEDSVDTTGSIYNILSASNTMYGMVANASGNVVWKGALTILNCSDSDWNQHDFYAVGGVICERYNRSYEEPNPEDPSMPGVMHQEYYVNLTSAPVNGYSKVYFSTVAF